MRLDELRAAIIQEWLDLAPENRQSEHQAAIFATRASQRYPFDPGKDPFSLIMHWLDPYIPQRAGEQPTLSRTGVRRAGNTDSGP